LAVGGRVARADRNRVRRSVGLVAEELALMLAAPSLSVLAWVVVAAAFVLAALGLAAWIRFELRLAHRVTQTVDLTGVRPR
jgi:hypothetical protein